MEETWKDSMRRKLENFEAEAPEGLWDDIEKKMAAMEAAAGNGGKDKSKLRVAWRWAAAAACAACIAGYFILPTDKNGDGGSLTAIEATAGRSNSSNNKADNGELRNEGKVLLHDNTAVGSLLAAISPTTSKAGTAKNNDRNITTTGKTANETDIITEEAAAPSTSGKENTTAEEKKGHSVVVTGGKPSGSGQYSQHNTAYGQKTSRSGSIGDRVSLGLYAMNGGSSSSASGSGAPMVSQSVQLMCNETFNESEESLLRQIYEAQTPERSKHRMPIRSGLSVRYNITGRLGVETGLSYTYLSSEFSSGSNKDGLTTEQKLHFVGIPVNVSYTLWKNKTFNVYAMGGGMAEMNVKGTSTATTMIGGQVADVDETDIKTKRLQWSVNAAVGAQVNLYGGVGLYVEPGVSYYIGNGTDVKSAYTEKPCNFNLKIGLRYSFK